MKNSVGEKHSGMGALPPNPRDFSLSCQDSWAARTSSARPRGIPAPESALGSHPCVALSSAPVHSVYQERVFLAWPFTQIT